MPPRRATRTTASSGQSKLSFGAQSRVTKPSTTAPGKQVKNTVPIVQEISKTSPPDTALPQQIPVSSSAASSEPHVAEVAIREQAKDELSQPASKEDRKALEISEAQITQYWNNEEHNRIAQRVHQKDLDIDEKVLRHFDLSSQYGPCIGISRIKRWRRAHLLELDPPIEVLAILLKKRGAPVSERAYMDELLS
ncbi:hypothetical protein UA08_07226 [Talaromyces atroroseus]|uniref:DNA polymerase delta subunit 4 n=1 Tax=Talaromyces atroroseus TaxID=1441469 RepID=A0A225A9L6_TALAT|nr:hypothetical protein UA08_07226 [Talaromyces atroroseus]OKL57452.1 hypothetical protein UA08_07226 [Talaromyces atroroseus]